MSKHYELNYGDNDYNPIYLMNGEKDDFILRASSLDKSWVGPGEVVAKVIDTEDGLIISLGNRTIKLNYFEAEILRLALKLNNPDVKLYEVTKKVVK